MFSIRLAPVVGTAVNQESSKGTIFSLLFFQEQLGDFLVAPASPSISKGAAHLVWPALCWEQGRD